MTEHLPPEEELQAPSEIKEDISGKPALIDRGWFRVLIFIPAFLFIIGVFQTISFLILGAAGMLDDNTPENLAEGNLGGTWVMTGFQIAMFLGSIICVWLFRRFIDKKTVNSLGLSWSPFQKDAALGFLMGIVVIGFGFLVLYATGLLKVTGIQLDFETLVVFFGVLVMVAIGEELVVRGYVLRNLMDSMNKWWALAVSALLFSVMHSLNPNVTVVSFINIFLAGILLGLYYVYRQNLWFPIFLHLSWNYFQGPIFGFEVSGLDLEALIQQDVHGSRWLTGGSFGFEGSLLLTGIMLLVIGWVEWYYGRGEEDSLWALVSGNKDATVG